MVKDEKLANGIACICAVASALGVAAKAEELQAVGEKADAGAVLGE